MQNTILIEYISKNGKFFKSYTNRELQYVNSQCKVTDRIYADICGFLNGMRIREGQLNKMKCIS